MTSQPTPPKKQSRVTGALALMIAQAIVLLFGYVTHLWIGRVLGPAPYGLYGVVLAVQSIVGLILTLGVPVAVARFVARHEDQAQSILRQTLRLQALVALLVSVATLLLAPIIAHVLGDDTLRNLIRFVSLVIFLQAFYTIFVQFFSGLHRFNRQAILTSIYAVIKLLGAISLIYFIGVYGAFAGFAIGGVVAALLGWVWARRVGGQSASTIPSHQFLSFAGVYVIILVSLQFIMSIDLFMVKALLEHDDLAGFYNASSTLARIPYMLLQGLAYVLLPSVSALTKPGASHTQAAAFIRDTLRYLIALVVPAVGLAAATSKGLIILFYSTAYLPAAASLTILMIGLGSLAFYLLLANIVVGAGRARVGLIVTILMAVASSLLGLILIPRFGLMGAAWQTTLTSLVGLGVLAIYTFRTFRIPVPILSILNIFIASAAAISVTYIWHARGLALILQYLIVFAIYGAVLLVLREVKPSDRQRIAKIHPRLQWLAPPGDI